MEGGDLEKAMLDAEEWYMIREMKDRGMSISEIARQMSMSRNTVKRHLRMNKPMEYKREKRQSKLDGVKPIIRMLIEKYDLSARISFHISLLYLFSSIILLS